jgi:transposase
MQQRQTVLAAVATHGMSEREVQQLMGLLRRVRENLQQHG